MLLKIERCNKMIVFHSNVKSSIREMLFENIDCLGLGNQIIVLDLRLSKIN